MSQDTKESLSIGEAIVKAQIAFITEHDKIPNVLRIKPDPCQDLYNESDFSLHNLSPMMSSIRNYRGMTLVIDAENDGRDFCVDFDPLR